MFICIYITIVNYLMCLNYVKCILLNVTKTDKILDIVLDSRVKFKKLLFLF